MIGIVDEEGLSFADLPLFMDVALWMADKSDDEVPVGAAIFVGKRLLVSSCNRSVTHGDATQHAEMVALRAAMRILGRNLSCCRIFVTVEPCPMCAYAISLARCAYLYIADYSAVTEGSVYNMPMVFCYARYVPKFAVVPMTRCRRGRISSFFKKLRD